MRRAHSGCCGARRIRVSVRSELGAAAGSGLPAPASLEIGFDAGGDVSDVRSLIRSSACDGDCHSVA